MPHIQEEFFDAMDTNQAFQPSQYTISVGRTLATVLADGAEIPWDKISSIPEPGQEPAKRKLSTAGASGTAKKVKIKGKSEKKTNAEDNAEERKEKPERGKATREVNVKGKGKQVLVKEEPRSEDEVCGVHSIFTMYLVHTVQFQGLFLKVSKQPTTAMPKSRQEHSQRPTVVIPSAPYRTQKPSPATVNDSEGLTPDQEAQLTSPDPTHIINVQCRECIKRNRDCEKEFKKKACKPCRDHKTKCTLTQEMQAYWLRLYPTRGRSRSRSQSRAASNAPSRVSSRAIGSIATTPPRSPSSAEPSLVTTLSVGKGSGKKQGGFCLHYANMS